jgi:hypothetical protein
VGLHEGQVVCLRGLLLQAVKRVVCCSAVLSQGAAVLVMYCMYVVASSVSVLRQSEFISLQGGCLQLAATIWPVFIHYLSVQPGSVWQLHDSLGSMLLNSVMFVYAHNRRSYYNSSVALAALHTNHAARGILIIRTGSS